MAIYPFIEGHGTENVTWMWGTAAPSLSTDGTFKVGDIVWNTVPAGGGATYIGWVNVTGGSPGTWKGFGLIEA